MSRIYVKTEKDCGVFDKIRAEIVAGEAKRGIDEKRWPSIASSLIWCNTLA